MGIIKKFRIKSFKDINSMIEFENISLSYGDRLILDKINFKITGFDNRPIQSLFIEAKKVKYVNKQKANKIFNYTKKNYNRYGFSLLQDKIFARKLKLLKIKKNNRPKLRN